MFSSSEDIDKAVVERWNRPLVSDSILILALDKVPPCLPSRLKSLTKTLVVCLEYYEFMFGLRLCQEIFKRTESWLEKASGMHKDEVQPWISAIVDTQVHFIKLAEIGRQKH